MPCFSCPFCNQAGQNRRLFQRQFLFYEVYDNEAAFQSRRTSEHFRKYAEVAASMVAKRVSRTMSVTASNSHAK
jgi:quinol monooxygenase YgiN